MEIHHLEGYSDDQLKKQLGEMFSLARSIAVTLTNLRAASHLLSVPSTPIVRK